MFTVRVADSAGRGSRDHTFETKREALAYIASLGKLGLIKRFPKLWVVIPKPKK